MFGVENVIDADVHLDEKHEYIDPDTHEPTISRAHMHFVFVPAVTEETRVKKEQRMVADKVTGEMVPDRDAKGHIRYKTVSRETIKLDTPKLLAKAVATPANINRANNVIHEMCLERFGVKYMTGRGKRKRDRSIEEAKQASAKAAEELAVQEEARANAATRSRVAAELAAADAQAKATEARAERDAAQAERDEALAARDAARTERDTAQVERDAKQAEVKTLEATIDKAERELIDTVEKIDEHKYEFELAAQDREDAERMRKEADAAVRAAREEATVKLMGLRQSEDDALELSRHARAAKETYEKAAEEYREATRETRSVQVLAMDGQTFLTKFFEEVERRFRDRSNTQWAGYVKNFRKYVIDRQGLVPAVIDHILAETRPDHNNLPDSLSPRVRKADAELGHAERTERYVEQNRRLRARVDRSAATARDGSGEVTAGRGSYPGMPRTRPSGTGSSHGGLGLR